MAYQTNNQTAIELYLYASNTAHVMRNSVEPAFRNLERKQRKGTFDRTLAVQLLRYSAEYAAKEYVREYCSAGEKWHEMFTVQDRRDCAAELLDTFERETACGNGWLDRVGSK